VGVQRPAALRAASRALVAAVIALCLVQSGAASGSIVQGDYDNHPLRLESFQPVTTWEEDGVRVFVAEDGAVLRQGAMRLAAPRMVVWFDKAKSARPDVRAAVLRVYVEGLQRSDGTLSKACRLVEGDQVQRCGAAYLQLRSNLSFVWDCRLVETQARKPSVLLARAEAIAGPLEEDTLWRTVPEAEVVLPPRVMWQNLKAETFTFFRDTETKGSAVYVGDVHGTYNNMELRADAAVLWYDSTAGTFELYARGNVRLFRKPGVETQVELPTELAGEFSDVMQLLSADEIYVNPGTHRGLLTDLEVRMRDPRVEEGLVYVVRGKEAYMLDSRNLTVREASATTCNFARPHYQFHAGTLQVVRQHPSTILSAWDVALT